MNRYRRNNFHQWLIALVAATIGIITIAPLLALLVREGANLDELIAPTRVAQIARTRTIAARKPQPTFTPTPVPPTAAPLPVMPNAINGIRLDKIIVLSDAVREHIRDIYSQGQSLGRNPHAFSKVGDSTMVYPPFMQVFDSDDYNLAAYARLQTTIDYHAGSFERISAAVKKGMHTWTQFDATWAPPDSCQPGEAPLYCELRLQNPSLAFIRLGANDTTEPGLFKKNLTRIVQYCLDRGIIPVVGTKPDRYEGPSNTINNLVRQVAAQFAIPLWDYDVIVGTIPGRGLEKDQIHMRGGGTRNFASARAFQSGDSVEDLTALLMLDAIHRELLGPGLASR